MKLFSNRKKTVVAPVVAPKIGDQVTRDWGLTLAGFVVLILVAVLIDGYLLFRVSRGDFLSTAPVSELNAAVINPKALLNVADFFEVRQKEYDAFRATAAPQIDPSI